MTNQYAYTPDLPTFERLANEGYNLIPVYREISADLETPVSAFIKIARGSNSFLFESVEGGEHVARYSFLGTEPAEVIKTGSGTANRQRRSAECVEGETGTDPLSLGRRTAEIRRRRCRLRRLRCHQILRATGA